MLYVAAYAILGLGLGLWIRPDGFLLADFVLLALIAVLLFHLSRRLPPYLLLMALLVGIFYVGSGVKIHMLERPIMPDDVYNVAALIRIMGWKGYVMVGLPLLLPVLLFLGNLKIAAPSHRRAAALLLLLPAGADLAPALPLKAMDAVFGNAAWDQRENFLWRGPIVHLVQESLRALVNRRPAPTETEVAAALARLAEAAPTAAPPVAASGRRNIHVILLESFWDPTPLLGDELKAPLLDPRFQALWAETGRSEVLVPAFSGGTANSEFELLCGFPIASWAVTFELGFNPAPCLPRLLAARGYRAIASHPNDAGFWNRQSAYGKLGFQAFWSKPDFERDEVIAWMLSDRSYYRQVDEKLATLPRDAPVFDWRVTLYGHWAYDMVPERPSVVAVDPAMPELAYFATAMHHKSRELMDEIERLRRDDPDSLIIAFGDHLPNLGGGWGGYRRGDYFQGGWSDLSPAQYLNSRRTPIVVIDGRNGPLKLGLLPLYRLPRLILDRIGLEERMIGDLIPSPAGLTLRPTPEVTVVLDEAGAPRLCSQRDEAAPCDRANRWLADQRLIARDIFDGEGFALRALASAP